MYTYELLSFLPLSDSHFTNRRIFFTDFIHLFFAHCNPFPKECRSRRWRFAFTEFAFNDNSESFCSFYCLYLKYLTELLEVFSWILSFFTCRKIASVYLNSPSRSSSIFTIVFAQGKTWITSSLTCKYAAFFFATLIKFLHQVIYSSSLYLYCKYQSRNSANLNTLFFAVKYYFK